MKKILIIGSADSVFVKDFIAQIAAQGVIIDLISFSESPKNKTVRHEAHVVSNIKGRFGILMRQLDLFLRTRQALKKMESNYDAIVLHFVFFFLAPHIFLMRAMTRNIVAVIWGSDFYRSGRAKSAIQRIIYSFSQSIVFTNPATKSEFEKKNGLISKTKLKVARFGLPVLDEVGKIKSLKLSRSEICTAFGLPVEKVLIFVGYNANLSQQQIFVIENFAAMSDSIKSKAVLVFALGYGDGSAEKKIKESLELNKVNNFIILNKFYGLHEIARLRCVTDVLINIQPSDQFSGSMQEVLYAGGRVIAGKWLPYDEIINAGAQIRSIESPDQIGDAIRIEIELGIKAASGVNEVTKNFIENSSSWRENLKIWNGIIFP